VYTVNLSHHFRVDNDLETVGMKHTAHVGIELVKLVDRLAAVDLPQDTVVEYKFVRRVKRGAVPRVVACLLRVIERQK